MTDQELAYPLLSLNELVTSLNSYNITTKSKDLTEPSSQYVQHLYESVISQLTGQTRHQIESLYLNDQDMLQDVEYPELYNSSIGLMGFCLHVSNLFGTFGINDFGLKDILKPEASRLRHHASALINFLKFKDDLYPELEEHFKEIENMQAEIQKLQREESEIKDKFEQLEFQREQEQPEVDRLNEELAEKKLLLSDAIASKEAKKAESEEIKKIHLKQKEEIDQAQSSLQQIKEEYKELEKRVAEDPKLLLRDLDRLKACNLELANRIKATEEEEHRLRLQVQTRNIVCRAVNSTLAAAKSLHNVIQSVDELKEKIPKNMERIVSLEEQIHKKQASNEELARKVTFLKQKLEKFEKGKARKRKFYSEKLEAVRSQANKDRELRDSNYTKLEDLRNKIHKLHQTTEDALKVHEKTIDELRDTYLTKCAAINSYCDEIGESIEQHGFQ